MGSPAFQTNYLPTCVLALQTFPHDSQHPDSAGITFFAAWFKDKRRWSGQVAVLTASTIESLLFPNGRFHLYELVVHQVAKGLLVITRHNDWWHSSYNSLIPGAVNLSCRYKAPLRGHWFMHWQLPGECCPRPLRYFQLLASYWVLKRSSHCSIKPTVLGWWGILK